MQREDTHPSQLPSLPESSPPPHPLFDRPKGCIDQLTEAQRAAIVTLWLKNETRKQIAQQIPCSVKTVGHWIREWQERRSLNDKERSGRPRCTTDDDDQSMQDLAEEKKFTTPRRIKNELSFECSIDTVRRRLNEVSLYGRVSRKEYPFSELHIQRRLSFAEGYAWMKEDDWARVIFSDETYIEVWGRSRVWVQRPPGAAFDEQYMSNSVPHSDRVSLWGCFCSKGVGQAEIFVGRFDAAKYVDIIAHNLIQTASHFYPTGHWYFQQDNAPQHTSIQAKKWFHNHGVDLIDFPPYSPDLNPIENLWGILKTRVEQRLAVTIEEVEQVLRQEWEALEPSLLANLVNSMPARCQAVIANKGHTAGY